MKKLALATAISAATISSGAHAVIGSFINPATINVVISGLDIAIDCANTWNPPPFVTGLELSGPFASQIDLLGQVCLNPYGFGTPYIALDFHLRGAESTSPSGTIFNLGGIDIYTDWGTGTGWVYYSSVDASTTAINCLSNGTTVAGMQWAALPSANFLPGKFGVTPANLPTCQTTLLGYPTSLYLSGVNWK